MKKFASLLLVVLAATVPPLRAAEDLFTFTPIVDGVYAAISHPAYKTNCNAVVVLLDDGVLVVDTHSKPSAARELIAQIKKVTDKPVKYVVNTHFHWDHFQGNQSYVGVWRSSRSSAGNTRRNFPTSPRASRPMSRRRIASSAATRSDQGRTSLAVANHPLRPRRSGEGALSHP